ncbi:hypothetical protein [Streptomyces flaveolus]|uniref:hypothetical protein n=1 Tax=Streptomyces flaveolus TaxID=67297 RepID=UPI0036FA09BE
MTARITTQPDTPDTAAASGTAAPAASGTPAAAVADGLGVYLVIVFMNTDPHSFAGYRPHHPHATATRTDDGSPLLLVFRATDRICSHEAVADVTFVVGNRQGPDDTGQTWPADIRSAVHPGPRRYGVPPLSRQVPPAGDGRGCVAWAGVGECWPCRNGCSRTIPLSAVEAFLRPPGRPAPSPCGAARHHQHLRSLRRPRPPAQCAATTNPRP